MKKHLWMMLLFCLLFCLLSCQPAMDRQPKVKAYSPSSLFADQRSARNPVPGTLPYDRPSTTPPKIDLALLQRGQELYQIHCSVCHGLTGDGNGMAVQRGFPSPGSYHSSLLRHRSSLTYYQFISEGGALMPSFGRLLAPSERWAIVAYIRALQLSRHFPKKLLKDNQ